MLVRRKLRKSFTAAMAALALATAFTGGCGGRSASEPAIACTTSMLGAVVRQIAGPEADVVTIVPSGMCPGHFDVKPGDIASVAGSRLLLYHGWEKWLDNLVQAVDRPELKKEQVALAGSWMVPDTHIRGVETVRDRLIVHAPGKQEVYTRAARSYTDSVVAKAAELKDRLAPLAGTRVLCSEMQKDLLQWAGCTVVGSYGRSEDLSPKFLGDLIRAGKEHRVALVADNLQSGAKTGLRISEETGARHVVLTNFPVDGSYLAALEKNVRTLLPAGREP